MSKVRKTCRYFVKKVYEKLGNIALHVKKLGKFCYSLHNRFCKSRIYFLGNLQGWVGGGLKLVSRDYFTEVLQQEEDKEINEW